MSKQLTALFDRVKIGQQLLCFSWPAHVEESLKNFLQQREKNNDCRYEVTLKLPRSQRSVEISIRFHGWVTWLTRTLKTAGVNISRDEIYLRSLLRACMIEYNDLGAGDPYPYIIVKDIWYPKRTTNRTNKEMMTACLGVQLFAFDEYEINLGDFPEKPEVGNA